MEKNKKQAGEIVRGNTLILLRRITKNYTVLEVPEQCPLVLLCKRSLGTFWRLSKSTFLSNAHRFPEGHWFLEGSQASPICPSGKGTVSMKVGMDHW